MSQHKSMHCNIRDSFIKFDSLQSLQYQKLHQYALKIDFHFPHASLSMKGTPASNDDDALR